MENKKNNKNNKIKYWLVAGLCVIFPIFIPVVLIVLLYFWIIKKQKNAKLVYNFDYIEEFDNFSKDKCEIKFENQIVNITQGHNRVEFPVCEISKVCLWIEGIYLICKLTKNDNKQYKMGLHINNNGKINNLTVLFVTKALKNYFKLFDIKVEVDKNDEISEDDTCFKSYFLGADSLRKMDGNVQRGDCEIIFEGDIFKIKQNEEIIENDINSIYYFDIWEFKDFTYFKFFMSSHTEYKFCEHYFEADKIAKILTKKGIKVEDNRDINNENE